MKNHHWSDLEIQEYLEGVPPKEGRRRMEHLETCRACRRRLEQYQSLFTGLAVEPEFELPPDFGDRVWRRHNRSSRQWELFPALGIVLAIASIMAVFIHYAEYIGGWNPVSTLSQYLQPFIAIVHMIQMIGDQAFTWIRNSLPWLVWAGLLMVITALFDGLVQRFRISFQR